MKPEEGITPTKYQQAVKSESFGDEFAKGRAAGQDISDPAQIRAPPPSLPRAAPLLLISW